MEEIRQAVERARARQTSSGSDALNDLSVRRAPSINTSQTAASSAAPFAAFGEHRSAEIELNTRHLLSKRVVCHDGKDQRSRPYDVLRTQVLQTMDANGWKVLGITSPTPKCGKTLTAINLAFSVARKPDRTVVLADLDLQRPQLSQYFGVKPLHDGILGVLERRSSVRNVTMHVTAGSQHLAAIPTVRTKESAELMGSREMGALLRDLRNDFQISVLDLPPILSGDDVIALLPQVDCVLLVATVGLTKASEVEECVKLLEAGPLIRIVLNKATDMGSGYYY